MFVALRNRALTPIFLITFISVLASTMIGAIQILFALDLGATYVEIGLISLLGGVISMAIRIPFGIFSDKVGRKPLLFIPELVIFFSSVIRSLATQPWHLIIAGLIGGFSGGAFMPVVLSLIGDLTTPSERADAVSTHYLFSSLGMFLGPSVASSLLLFVSIRRLLYINALIRLSILVLIWLGIKEEKKAPVEALKTSFKGDVIKLLKRRNMVVALIARLSTSFFQSIFQTYVPILSRGQGLPDALIAALGTFQGVTRIGVRLCLARLVRAVSAKKLSLITLCICSIIGLLLPSANGFYSLAIAASLFGVFHGIASPLSALLVADVSTSSERGLANSILYSAMYVGTFTPILTAPIAEVWGVAYVFPFGSIPPIAVMILTAKFMRPLSTEQREPQKEG